MKGFNCCLASLSRENKELKERERKIDSEALGSPLNIVCMQESRHL
ncbi:hypothetical protein ES332_A05G154800v1 [Gossypium tomentosum]|uniref:Uncharacterized protein n=1 Tax=Gossypium tomentosum TaxID=34277 RepID=A0A5D2QIQ9_GOSTO|nr:hypothetical protein ES332_A05G154800v1 [Gossypium tomentosum]